MKRHEPILVRPYESPCGTLLLGSFDGALCLCDWRTERHSERVDRQVTRILGSGFEVGHSDITDRAARQIDEYFARTRRSFDLPLLFAGTPFQRRVWEELRQIPYGMTCSYGELARRIDSPQAARAVANANSTNPLSLFAPCHRVVGGNRALTGYGGGLAAKKYLLDLESQPQLGL